MKTIVRPSRSMVMVIGSVMVVGAGSGCGDDGSTKVIDSGLNADAAVDGGGGGGGGGGVYVGMVDLSINGFGPTTAQGVVTWTSNEVLSDVSSYLASGTLAVTISPEDCDPVTDQLTIETGTASSPISAMNVYLEGSAFGTTHDFGLSTVTKDITFQCGSPRTAVTIPTTVTVIVGICTAGFAPISYGDINLLTGAFSCADAGLNATWSFAKQ